MKKAFAILVTITLILSLFACSSADKPETPSTTEAAITEQIETTSAPTEVTEETEEAPTVETSAAPLIDDPEQLKTLLMNIFSNDAYQTLVTVKDGTASVFITYDELDSLYADAINGSQDSMELWDSMVSSFLGLHDSARGLMSTLYGNYSLKTILSNSKSFPYLSITDGEVTLDFFHIGE